MGESVCVERVEFLFRGTSFAYEVWHEFQVAAQTVYGVVIVYPAFYAGNLPKLFFGLIRLSPEIRSECLCLFFVKLYYLVVYG